MIIQLEVIKSSAELKAVSAQRDLLTWDTKETLILGRKVTQLSHDPNISRNHLKLSFENKLIVIKDMGSKNGTYLNGVQIFNNHLYLLDIIKIGDTLLKISDKNLSEAEKTCLTYQGNKSERLRGEVTLQLDIKKGG